MGIRGFALLVVPWLLLAGLALASVQDGPSTQGDLRRELLAEHSAEEGRQPEENQGELGNDEPKAESDTSAPREEIPTSLLVASLTIFVLAIFIGFEVITKVPPTLHTPLMSGSNAISGITIVGALLVAGEGKVFPAIIGMLAVALATVNVVGGFLVTHRMLSMFQKKPSPAK